MSNFLLRFFSNLILLRFGDCIGYTFIDVDDSRLTYEDGLALIRSIIGMNDVDGSIVNRMAQKERNGVLRELRKRGFTAKQIERLTGVPVAIIYKA